MSLAYVCVLLLMIGLALLVAELFIPSGGLILVAAITSIGGSVVCAWIQWKDSPTYWWSYIASVVLLIPSVLAAAFYILPRTSIGKRVLLEPPTLAEVTPFAAHGEKLARLIGSRGETLTLLTPGGMVLVDGQRHHCESEGMLIEPGEPVIVIGLKLNRLVVRPTPVEEKVSTSKEAAEFALPEELEGELTTEAPKAPQKSEDLAAQQKQPPPQSSNSLDLPLDIDFPQG